MIAMIKGTVFAVGLDWIIIENQGIGYKVFFSRPGNGKIKPGSPRFYISARP